jgi:hypothetical protein
VTKHRVMGVLYDLCEKIPAGILVKEWEYQK